MNYLKKETSLKLMAKRLGEMIPACACSCSFITHPRASATHCFLLFMRITMETLEQLHVGGSRAFPAEPTELRNP
ncbi:uncharacterized [Tachysurus ichikawai]